jgi:aryl-alcohol dehydrogenase-like predicted oxidoreductase
MQYTTFGRTGLKVSRLAFGAGPIGYLGASPEQAGRVLNLLLDRGVNLIDTAAAYLGSEELIGRAVGHRRDSYLLLSKCGRQVEGVTGADWSAQVVTQTVDRSLKRLGTDHLDVMLLHSCPLPVLERGEALGALVRAREAGKLRFAGYSGDNAAAAYAALPAAVRAGVGVIAKRSVANAAWKPAEAQSGLYRDYARSYADRFRAMALDPRELGCTGADPWMEIALRFTLALDGVQVLSVGTTSTGNAEANLALLEAGPLAPAAVARIRQAFQAAQARSGADWPGLT